MRAQIPWRVFLFVGAVVLALATESAFAAGHGGGGGSHGGGFGSGGFHGGGSGGRSFGVSSMPHSHSNFSAPHSSGGFTAERPPAGSFGGATMARSFDSQVRGTQPFGNLGAIAANRHVAGGAQPGTSASASHTGPATGPSGAWHHEGGAGGKGDRHEHHVFVFFGGFFPFDFFPFWDWYGYPHYWSRYGYPYDCYYDPVWYGYEAPYPPESAASATPDQGNSASGEQYYADAAAAFQRGDYETAARMAAHGLVDMPRDARVHELLSLAMFARGDYRAASMEAHAAVVLGLVADWPTLYAHYNDLPTYTKQLAALAEYVGKNPSAWDARFLLAWHDLMMRHTEAAKELLAQVVTHVPRDTVAADLLNQLKGGTAGPIATVKGQPRS